jgi:hypothetical protein
MDLSELPDDQFLQLIAAVFKEITRRAISLQFAANKYRRDAVEEILKNTQPQSQTQSSQPKSNWWDDDDPDDAISTESQQATVASLIKSLDFFQSYKYHNFSLNIWERNGDIRVYIQQSFKSGGWEMVYYHTGNSYKSPGAIECLDLKVHLVSGFQKFARMLCQELTPGFKCYANDDGKYPVNHTLKQQYWSKLS